MSTRETAHGLARPVWERIAIGRQIWTNQTAYDVVGVVADYMSSPVESRLAVRIAIGADRGHQIRLVMAHSVRLVLLGSALGVALTFGLSRLVRAAGGAGTLYDPPWPAFLAPVVMVLIVAALATWIAARRALRVNPASLLKAT